MLVKDSVLVEMNRRGVYAQIALFDDVDRYTHYYTILAGSRALSVLKGGVKLIDENDVGDPTNPTSQERAVLIMSKELEGFDEHLYDIGCTLATYFCSSVTEEKAQAWLDNEVEEILHNES